MRGCVVAHRGRILIALLLPVVALLGMAGQIAGAPPATPAASDSGRLREATAAVLAPDSGRGVPRLTSVDIDSTGDATIVIALRAGDTEREIVEGGESDFLAVFRAVYHPAPVASVRTTTVIGTYPVTGQYGTREWPVMRAVLTHQTADRIDWYHLTASQLPAAVDTWWVYPPLLAATPVAGPSPATPSASLRS